MKRPLAVALVALCALSAPRYSRAQIAPAPTGRCAMELTFDRTGTVIKLPSGQRNFYVGGNVVGRCPKQRMVLKADSLEYYGDEGRAFFIGNVDYTEPRLKLKSDYLTYFQKEERLLAYLQVDATLASGSNLKGSHLEVWRAIPGQRKQHAVSNLRPTITINEKDPDGKPQPPVTVTGNTVWMEGDSTVASSGEVVVIRPELTASGDSLFLDGNTGLLRLMRSPRVLGKKGRPFTLVGQTIDVLSKQRRLDRVLAKAGAEATSQDLDLKSDTIDLRISSDVLQRAIAWGASRARAVSPQRTLLADSIDVLMPNQKLREMHALRLAVAEGAPDSAHFHTAEMDRLTGDTIVAFFDTTAAPVGDTTSKPRIRRLDAIGNATSLQHLPPRDTTLRAPAQVYVVGTTINVTFDTAGVQRVRVHNQQLASGIYIEPGPDSTRAPRGGAPNSSSPRQGTVAPAPGSGAARPATPPRGTPAPTAPAPLPAPTGSAPAPSTAVPSKRP